jgi:O-antigen biosynthesis protein
VLNSSLRDAWLLPNPPEKERVILFYGRPNSRRNCFYLIRRALEIWSSSYASASAWRVLSVGDRYEPFQLSGGVKLEVLGKLSLQDYADKLHRASVGVSLMASPHPSYPPLEMAHFGALTVCNNFQCKDMESWHENMMPVSQMEPHGVAAALTAACSRFDADQTAGMAGKTRKPQYTSDPDPSILLRIGNLIAGAIQ